MSQFEEVLQALNSLKEELNRLRKIEQEYRKLKQEYETILKQMKLGEELMIKPFYFFSESGVYTGYSALNFTEFFEAFDKIPLISIEFHTEREDFEKWLRFIGMHDLAKEFENIRTSNLVGEKLKHALIVAMNNTIKH